MDMSDLFSTGSSGIFATDLFHSGGVTVVSTERGGEETPRALFANLEDAQIFCEDFVPHTDHVLVIEHVGTLPRRVGWEATSKRVQYETLPAREYAKP